MIGSSAVLAAVTHTAAMLTEIESFMPQPANNQPTMKTTSFTRLTMAALAALSLAATAADQTTTPPDNTEKNERDRSGAHETPIDQSNRPEDIKLVAEIRKAVVADDTLSMTAKNVKIITTPGKVTLRGPVNTAEEKTKIAAHAKAKAGASEIVDQIEVKAAEPAK